MQTLFQSPRDPKFFKDPFIFYKKVRATGSIVRWEDFDLAVTADYDTVNTVLRNKTFVREPPQGFFSGIPKNLFKFYENESRSMLEREPPYHTKIKGLVSPFFTNKRLKKLKVEMEYLCDKLIKNIPTPEFDLITSFSNKFPVLVISKLMGVPESMAPQLLKWSNNMVAMYQARRNKKIEEKAVEATKEFSAYIKNLLIKKKLSPSEDLISYLIHDNYKDQGVSESEIISTIILILNAGHEATVHTISNGMKTILESSVSVDDLIKTPKGFVNEVLRYSTPLHMFTRYCTGKISLNGHTFKPGEKIGLLLAAANRDPAQFESPEVFDPLIKRKANLSLGAGIHFCLGAHLARLELEIALLSFVKSFPDLKIISEPIYQDSFHFHGLKNLFLRI